MGPPPEGDMGPGPEGDMGPPPEGDMAGARTRHGPYGTTTRR